MNGEAGSQARFANNLSGGKLTLTADKASLEVAPRWWECSCHARVSLREPACPFCATGYRPEYEEVTAA